MSGRNENNEIDIIVKENLCACDNITKNVFFWKGNHLTLKETTKHINTKLIAAADVNETILHSTVLRRLRDLVEQGYCTSSRIMTILK